MTEIVAAHLERVAREVESAIDHWCETGGQSVIELMNDLRPIAAAAMAACAREARKDEAVDWRDAAISLTRAAHEKWMEARLAELRALPSVKDTDTRLGWMEKREDLCVDQFSCPRCEKIFYYVNDACDDLPPKFCPECGRKNLRA